MTATPGPDRLDAGRRVHPSGALVLRIATAAAMVAVGIGLVLSERGARVLEAGLSQTVLAVVTGARTTTGFGTSPSILFSFGEQHWWVLQVTPECAAAFYAGGFVVFGGLMCIVPRLRRSRILVASAVAVLAMGVLNQVRLVALALVISHLGRDAFEWAHSLVGSFFMMAGITACLALFFALVVRPTRRDRERRPR